MIAVLLTIPRIASATSSAGCIDRGFELRADFTIRVTHADKPLLGATVQVEGGSESAKQLYSELTGADGRARFRNLPPGDYWINVEFFGIGAGYQCFHVDPSPSRKAKKHRRYDWGDMPISVRQATGRFVESQAGSDSTPLQRLINRVDVPIVGAQLELRQPFDGTVYKAVADSTGRFLFDNVPKGIYVLHIAANSTPNEHPIDSADFLIDVDSTARVGNLVLRHGATSIGGAQGTSIQIEVASPAR
jgi:hypothetical protein